MPTMPDYQAAAAWVIKRLGETPVVHVVTIAETLESMHRACKTATAPVHLPRLFPEVELGLIVIPPRITSITDEEAGPVSTEALGCIGKAILAEFDATHNDLVHYPLGDQTAHGEVIVFKPQALPEILLATGLHLLEVATND